MTGFLGVLGQLDILHRLVTIVGYAIILSMILTFLLSFLSSIDFVRPWAAFFRKVTSWLIEPIARRIPAMSLGMFDITRTIAFIFILWSTGIIMSFFGNVLPSGW
ncbi:MAG TPA: YggT family protein [Ktedonobacterales bacterium]